ncbi:MAG: hypothetical protein K2Z81_01970, partial [Cyanobacteria bacterium]|nr:hypothetical protein [Cyanobacteriota bacterium]
MPIASAKPPSVVELQTFIKQSAHLRILTLDGSSFTGRLRWFDDHAFSILLDDESQFTIVRANIIGYGRTDDEDAFE